MALKSEEVDTENTGAGAGGGGMSMMSGFTQLGGAIHDDSLESMSYFQKMYADQAAKRRQDAIDAFNKKKVKFDMAATRRGQNMDALGVLAAGRQSAGMSASRRGMATAWGNSFK